MQLHRAVLSASAPFAIEMNFQDFCSLFNQIRLELLLCARAPCRLIIDAEKTEAVSDLLGALEASRELRLTRTYKEVLRKELKTGQQCV